MQSITKTHLQASARLNNMAQNAIRCVLQNGLLDMRRQIQHVTMSKDLMVSRCSVDCIAQSKLARLCYSF